MQIKFNKDGPVTFGALAYTGPQINARAGDFAVVSGIVRNGVLGPAVGPVVRPDNAASVTITLKGVKYTADSGVLGDPFHLVGPVVNEYHKAVPLTNHITARWVIRKYVGFDTPRVDLVMESNWAFEPGPQTFCYDVVVSVGGKVVYSQTALSHRRQARWRMVFDGADAVADFQWLGTKAVPNYDTDFPPSEATLKRLAVCALSNKPGQIGAASPYFPTTGANEEIGILPMQDVAWLMSHDQRARDCMLATGNGAGGFPVHYRDKDTDLPVSLSNYPYMTIAGNPGDTWNEEKKRREAFPTPGNDRAAAGLAPVEDPKNGNDTPWYTPLTPDEAHQPSLAYTAYLATGDYFYMEEMQFWAMWNSFWDNPNYRGAGQGLIIAGELRAQAWALRTIAQAAFITPDAHPLKADLVGFVRNNIAWYTKQYVGGPGDNKIGVMTHGGSIAHDNGVSIAPWMHDYFVGALGHIIDLGFVEAKPFLLWMAQFTVGRMVGPGICWLWAAQYDLQVRDTNTSPVYDSLLHSYTNRAGVNKTLTLPCAGPEMAAALGLAVRDMGGISDGNMGYPAWYQPSLSAAVDAGYPGADIAKKDFDSRSVKPDFTLGAHFAIIPRTPSTPPPEGNPMSTFTVSVALSTSTVLLPAGSELAPTSTLVELLDADKVTVLGSTATAPYSLSGITVGDKFVRTTDYDSKGAPDAAVLTPFTITDDVVVPPADPVPVEAQRTTGVTVTYVKD